MPCRARGRGWWHSRYDPAGATQHRRKGALRAHDLTGRTAEPGGMLPWFEMVYAVYVVGSGARGEDRVPVSFCNVFDTRQV